ncbi:MAG TPA: CHASE domain-containing protein, partial [Rubrobacteraceae bacterium]|nr:CHASE domain-containing protein [Rubrobacteraceae bacterium]
MRRVFEHLRRMAVAYAVLLVALVLTFLAYHYVRQDVEDAARYRFSETVLAARSAIENQMGSYVDAMFGARALFYASDSVEMEEWGGYANGIDLTERYEGMRVLGYVRRVEPDDRDEFVEELSQTFDETDLTEPELRPEGERSVYFPITFVEPFDEVNQRLVGYDVYSNPGYQAVMDRARDTGEAEATRKAYVLTEAPRGSRADLALKPGFVVYLPIYSEGEPTSTVAQRRRALEGFVVGALEAEGLLRGTLETFDPSSMDFEVYDGEDLTPKDLLYDEDGVLRAGEAQAATTPLGAAIGEATGLPIG